MKHPKKVSAVFASAALLTGFFFMDRSATGNIVLNGHMPQIDLLSLIGLGLICCSAILGLYSFKKY